VALGRSIGVATVPLVGLSADNRAAGTGDASRKGVEMAEVSRLGPEPRAAAEATRTETFVWALLNAAPDGVIVVEDGGRVVLANRRAEALFGYDRGELLSVSLEDLVPERLREVHLAHRAWYGTDAQSRPMGDGLQLCGRRRDGSEVPIEISLSPMDGDSARIVIATIRPQRDTSRHDAALVFDEADRIARTLTEGVIRRLFGVGLSLQGAHGQTHDVVARRSDDAVDELDAIIHDIRATICGMRPEPAEPRVHR
jgi:PAS domain S-box-containing protein